MLHVTLLGCWFQCLLGQLPPAEAADSTARAHFEAPALLPKTIDLGDGAEIRLPPQFTFVRELKPLPAKVSRALLFADRAGGALLQIQTLRPDGSRCGDQVRHESTRVRKISEDPKQAQTFQLVAARPLLLGHSEAFFHEAGVRTALEARAQRPFHPVLNYRACAEGQGLALSFSRVAPGLTDADRAAVQAVLESWRPPNPR